MTDTVNEPTFEDAIRTHLIENRKSLVASAVSQAMERMAESMKWGAIQSAEKELNAFFVTDVAPEIKKYLEANREALIASVLGSLKTIVDGALTMHAEAMLKNLQQSYNRNKLLSALLGN
jgi:flagellar biosynthesis/type III secretory pathway protein FliH